MNYFVTGAAPSRAGNAHQNIVPYQAFACADGHLILAVGNDGQFAKFCDIAGVAWAQDPRFAKNADRVRNRDVLVPMVASVVATRTQHAWIAALEDAGVPCGPINKLDAVFADPQVVARGMRIEMPHALAGVVPQVASPVRIQGDHAIAERAPPLLGEHTMQILRDRLHMREDVVRSLAAERIVQIR
jgi:glutaryl-CoA transferase